MKIHRIDIASDTEGTIRAWAMNAVEATQKASEVLTDACEGRQFDPTTDSIKLIDFPETKREVVAWLNAYFNRDNG
jgi:hypothetical protein